MPTADRARAESALRRAHEAGDLAAARAIANHLKTMPTVVASRTDYDVQPGDVLPLPGTVPQEPAGTDWWRVGGEVAGGTAGGLAGFATGGPVLGVLGGGAGAVAGGELVDRLRGEGGSFEDTRDAFRQGALGSVIAAPIRGALTVGENVLRSLSRGLRPRPEARIAMQQQQAAQQAAGVVPDAGPGKTFMAEMAKAAGFGATADVLSGGLTGGTAAIVTSVLRLPAATQSVLANSPGFAKWALATGASAPTRAAAETAGQATVQIGEQAGMTARDVDDLIETMAAEGPAVANAIRDVIRELARNEEQNQ